MKAKVTFRGVDRVLVVVLNEDGRQIFDQYQDAAQWASDPDAILARIEEQLLSLTVAPELQPVDEPIIERTKKQLDEKRAAIAAAKTSRTRSKGTRTNESKIDAS